MKMRYLKRGGSFLLVLVILAWGYVTFFQSYTKGVGAYVLMDVPEWLEGNMDTSSPMSGAPGPTLRTGEDSYGVLRIRFYDAASREQITDESVVEELLAMFQQTEDSFVYDRERSEPGLPFFYYNGVLPAEHTVALFSEFRGQEVFEENGSGKPKSFYATFHASAIPASFSDDLEEALDEF